MKQPKNKKYDDYDAIRETKLSKKEIKEQDLAIMVEADAIRSMQDSISAEELEKKFDDGEEDILDYFDLNTASRRISIDLLLSVLKTIDAESKRLGVSSQDIIKSWIDEKIESINTKIPDDSKS